MQLKQRVVFPKPSKDKIAEIFRSQAKVMEKFTGSDGTNKISQTNGNGQAAAGDVQQAPSWRTDVIVVKFNEGTNIRHRNGIFMFDQAAVSHADHKLMERSKINTEKVKAEVKKMKLILEDKPQIIVEPMFSRPEEALDKEKDEAEKNSKEELADPNLYYYVYAKAPDPKGAENLINQLNELEIVEIAYPQPLSIPAAVDIFPRTLDFTATQGYLTPAPNGIDARYAWTITGGKGEDIRLIDVEAGWHLDHEDLPSIFWGGNSAFYHAIPGDQIEHGTAVLGVLAAGQNQFGMTGITPNLAIGASTVVRLSFTPIPTAIDDAAAQLRPGDIILIEQHAHGPSSGLSCSNGNCSQWEYVCQEYWQADFDTIRRATARGIIVVEAAGNGGMNLDSPIYENRFNRAVRDSGAILVGAGTSNGRAPQPWTNYGSRVDVQGWGDMVATLGYGNSGAWSRANGGDVRQFYTSGFSGTSSASPIVAGAVASIQGIRKARSMSVLAPADIRRLLQDTGTPQTGPASINIGPLPNIRAALDSLHIFPLPSTGWPSLGGIIISSPVISRNSDGRLEVFALGLNERLFHIWQTSPNGEWSAWEQLGDVPLRGRINVAITNDGRMEVFARGIDSAIWHIWQTAPNSGWSGWSSLGGIKTSSPVAIINKDGRMEVFARGTDNAYYHKNQIWANGDWWPWFGGWESMNGVFVGAPAVGRNPNGSLVVFGRRPDGAIAHKWQITPGGGWSEWTSLGGILTTDPVVAVSISGRIEVFGQDLTGALCHNWQSAPDTGWSGWESLGGIFPAGTLPGVITNAAGNLEVFMRGLGNTVWYNVNDGPPRFWSGWVPLGGSINGDPSAIMNENRMIEVVAQATNGSLVHRREPW